MEWPSNGWNKAELVEESHKLWGYSLANPRQQDDLIARARKEFVKQWEAVDRKEIVAVSMCWFDRLYRLRIQERQLAVSHAAEVQRGKLIGLNKLI